VKLPKLTLRKFNGDLTKWMPFWDSYIFSIHENPGLSTIDKFVQGSFGDTDAIVHKHMEALLSLKAVTSQYNLRALRRLHDQVEFQVRGLRALGMSAESYARLLSPVVLNKLPQELQLIVSREMKDRRLHLDELMTVIDVEIKARECASNTFTPNVNEGHLPKVPGKGLPINATLLSNELVPKCSYCQQQHSSISCRTVTDPTERKQILRKAGRCFVSSNTRQAMIVAHP